MLNKFKSISEIIDKEKDFENIRITVKNYSVVEDFQKIFPEIKTIAKAVKVVKGVLYLKVENSVWKSELNFQKRLLIEKINNHYKEKIINSVRFL